MKGRAVAGIVLLAAVGGTVLLLQRRGDGAGVGSGVSPTLLAGGFAGPSTCLPCHAAVVEEWKASMHASSFTDPQVRAPDQSDNFQKQECLPCHAPRPIFEHGIEKDARVFAREERRFDGVDCLSCHSLPEGVAATRAGLTAACKPVFRAELATQQVCYACHNQHNTHDEWRASPAAASNKDCLTCHMAPVTRTGSEAGAPRAGRSHRFLGGRDKDFALAGLSVASRVDRDQNQLVVELHNDFAGHNLPTDSRNRALDLVVTLYDTRGEAVPKPPDEKRDPGCETGTARLRFRNPYRQSGDPNTQLPAGQIATLTVPLPPTAARASVELFYKLSPWIKDTEAHWSHGEDVALR
jgi:hypothetical protein